MAEMLTAALKMASTGWHVFPCWPGKKNPATTNGLEDATTDIDKIVYWWQREPKCNIGIRTGSISGFVVLDIDGDEGTESLRTLERENSPLPRTLSIVTPSGGQHYYFRHPGGELRNSASKVGRKIDVRGDGGYVLTPPSKVDGRSYALDERAGLAPMPEWLLEIARRHRDGGDAQPTSEWLDMVQNGVQEGGRNHAMARLAGHFLRRYVDLELTREVCHLINRTKFKPPMPDWELDRTVDSVNASELQRRERNGA